MSEEQEALAAMEPEGMALRWRVERGLRCLGCGRLAGVPVGLEVSERVLGRMRCRACGARGACLIERSGSSK